MPNRRKIKNTDNFRNDLRILENYLEKALDKLDYIENQIAVLDDRYFDYVENCGRNAPEVRSALRYIKDDIESCLEHIANLDVTSFNEESSYTFEEWLNDTSYKRGGRMFLNDEDEEKVK